MSSIIPVLSLAPVLFAMFSAVFPAVLSSVLPLFPSITFVPVAVPLPFTPVFFYMAIGDFPVARRNLSEARRKIEKRTGNPLLHDVLPGSVVMG